MVSTVIPVSDDYHLHVDVSPSVIPDAFHLKVQTQRLFAKDPQALHTQFAVTLPRDQLAEIAAVIKEGTA